jgi:hypothetical protein
MPTEYVPTGIVAGKVTVRLEEAPDAEGVTTLGLSEHCAPGAVVVQLRVTP